MKLASSSADSCLAERTADDVDGRRTADGQAELVVAFRSLYREHRPRLYALCLRKTRDPVLSEDIVHDVFTKAFWHMSRYDANRPFWPWIASMASHRCIDVLRRDIYAKNRIGALAAGTADESRYDPTADDVVGRIEAQALERAVATLPARQRVAIQLFALDGWSYQEIAEQLGCTVASIKQLIVRARTTLRQTAARAPAALAGGLRMLSDRARLLLERLPLPVGAAPESAGAWMQAMAGVVTATMLASGVGLVVVPSDDGQPTGGGRSAATRGHSTTADAAPAPRPRTGAHGEWTPPSEAPLRPLQRALEASADDATSAVAPTGEPSAESGTTNRFTVSPRYEEDRTVYAGGLGNNGSGWLLVTRDGGASWQRPAAENLGAVYRVLLPPAYPDDPLVLALTSKGLQVSADGAQTFETLVPGNQFRDAVLSPAFDAGHPAVLLVGAGRLFEYRYDTGVLEPLLVEAAGIANNWVTGARYSTSYPTDQTVLVSTVSSGPYKPPALYRCRVLDGSVMEGLAEEPVGGNTLRCEAQTTLPDNRIFSIDLQHSRAGVGDRQWAAAGSQVYVSADDGRSFRRTGQGSRTITRWVRDLAPVPGRDGASVVVARTANGPDPVLERTDDGGATWTALDVDVPGFEDMVWAVTVTPTGRILVAANGGGLACSADGGRTWAATCPTPDIG